MNSLAIIVTGDHHAADDGGLYWRWRPVIERVLVSVAMNYDLVVVIHGSAPGIDSIADDAAQTFKKFVVIPMPAQWREYEKMGNRNAAGPKRNEQMLTVLRSLGRVGYDKMVLAFHDDFNNSRGTKDMVNIAIACDVHVEIYTSTGEER